MLIYNAMKLVLFNTSILTAHGTFTYEPISLDEARALLLDFQRNDKVIQSAIGHQSTAALLSMLLEYHVPVSRMEFNQTTADLALFIEPLRWFIADFANCFTRDLRIHAYDDESLRKARDLSLANAGLLLEIRNTEIAR